MSAEQKKIVLKVNLHDNKDKKKAMKAVSTLVGIDSLSMDMKDMKMTVTGVLDPIDAVKKLSKFWHTEILSVGPAKEDKKKEEAKKDEKKKDEGDKKKDVNEQVADLVKAYEAYNPYMTTRYYVQSAEENPNACVIS